jgi:hypothetical protein
MLCYAGAMLCYAEYSEADEVDREELATGLEAAH